MKNNILFKASGIVVGLISLTTIVIGLVGFISTKINYPYSYHNYLLCIGFIIAGYFILKFAYHFRFGFKKNEMDLIKDEISELEFKIQQCKLKLKLNKE